MNTLIKFSMLTVIGLTSIGAVHAQADASENVLSGYDKTGETTACISLSQLRNTKPVGSNAIMFKLRNGDSYLNELSSSCLDLTRNNRFGFKSSQNQICSGDIVSISNSSGTALGSCGLGEFDLLSAH